MKRKLNWKPDFFHPADKVYFMAGENYAVKPSVDLREMQSPVSDQGEIGSCTAQSLSNALEFLALRAISNSAMAPEVFSTQFDHISNLFIYYNERLIENSIDIDGGAQLRSGIKSIQRYGFCRESLWAYDPKNLFKKPTMDCYEEAKTHKEYDSFRVTSELQMKICLSNGFPFVFGIPVTESFMVATSGVIPPPTARDEFLGGHAILCVGYDSQNEFYWIKNSWGTGWGDHGYAKLSAYYMSLFAQDAWTIR